MTSIKNVKDIFTQQSKKAHEGSGGEGGGAQEIPAVARAAGAVAERRRARRYGDGSCFEECRVDTAGHGRHAMPRPTPDHVGNSSIDTATVKQQGASDVGDEASEVAERAVRGTVATRWSVVAQSNCNGGKSQSVGNRKHGVAGATGEYAELESAREDLMVRGDGMRGHVCGVGGSRCGCCTFQPRRQLQRRLPI